VAWDLQQLGPAGFQDLAAALAMQTFGAGVRVMGSGRDGGRDLYHKGQHGLQFGDVTGDDGEEIVGLDGTLSRRPELPCEPTSAALLAALAIRHGREGAQ
jgi:hypothetical protein